MRIGILAGAAGLERLGSDYGGWWIPEGWAQPGRVAYCLGAGEDITFDRALLERGCTVRTVDPTPRAILHVESLEIDNDLFRFEPTAVWSEDTTLQLFAPANPEHVSHSALNLQDTSEHIDVPAVTLDTLLTRMGDDRIDLLKMDIEGAELEVLPSVFALPDPPHVLNVEFDAHRHMSTVRSLVRRAKACGYRPAKAEGYNVLFLRDDPPLP